MLNPEEIIQKQFNIQNYLNSMSTFYPLTDGVDFCMMLTGNPLGDITALESIIGILSQYQLEVAILPKTVTASRHNPFERILQVASEYTQTGRACHEKELMDMQKDLNAASIHHFVSQNTQYKLELPLTAESKIIYKGYLQTLPISKLNSGQRPVFKGEALCKWVIQHKRFLMPKTVVQETNFQHQAIKDA